MKGRPLAARAGLITPFIVMDILEKAKKMEAKGEDIVHLEIGEPDFDPPPAIRRAAAAALDAGATGYAPSLGLPELRGAIARHYDREYGVPVSADRVIVTSGSSPALQMIFASLLEPGDEVIMTDPHYPCYANFVRFFGGVPVFVETREEENFRFSPDDIAERITSRTRALLINSPANPTGVVIPPADLEAIAGLGVTVVSDEIYGGLLYDGAGETFLRYDQEAFVVDGFSKRYAMTGWRLGYAVVPARFVRPLERLVQNFFISAPTLSQWGGIAALREAQEDVARMREIFRGRRDLLMEGLARIGLPVASRPAGAFYLMVNVRRFTDDSLAFAHELLEKAGVAVAPGIDFGEGGEGFIRLSYTASLERLEEGLARIGRHLRGRGER